jgi:hypothetical protein
VTEKPCACGSPAYRELCATSYCVTHYSELVMTFDPSSFPSQGRGLPGRTDDPNDLTCTTCKATWHGTVGEPCHYCDRYNQRANQWQTDDLLSVPDVDIDADDYDRKMSSWAKRLRRAVDNGVITDIKAQGAIRAAAKYAELDRQARTELRTGKQAS